MNTIELRSLLTKENKSIVIPGDFGELFKIWKKLRIESYNKDIQPLEIFYAGYVLANPNVREQFKKLKQKKRNNV